VMEASVASLAAVCIHGMVDDVLYGSRGLLLLFVPTGIMLAAASQARYEAAHALQRTGEANTAGRPGVPGLAISGALGIGVAVVLLMALSQGHPVAAWYANQGALAQTRAELELYDPERFAELDIDQVRRQVDLSVAEMRFLKALEEPEHPTAPRRLASIYLARGEYTRAWGVMEASWQAGNRDPGTRLLYGDALVATGEPAQAAQVIRGLPFAVERLEGQAWSRYQAREEWEQLAYAYEAIGLVTGNVETALDRVNEARERAGLAPLEALPGSSR